jgi:hypothetical protein
LFLKKLREFAKIGCLTEAGSTPEPDRAKRPPRMLDVSQPLDPALRAANLALAGRKRQDDHRLASIELRFSDPRHGPWELAALACVAIAAMLFVLALWFL